MSNDSLLLETKTQYLREIIQRLGSAAIAFSGGVDSVVLAKVACEELGDRAIAMTADSPSLPRRELAEARQMAELIGIRHIVFPAYEMEDPRYTANPTDRCYFCKTETFTQIEAKARQLGLAAVCYGENADDAGDHRPGAQAAAEFGVCAPLKEAGLAKAEIRSLAQQFGLPDWDKPAAACLSSRFPYGEQITSEKLAQVEAAEDVLWQLGFRACRVRYHGDTARIEVPLEDMPALVGFAAEIAARFQECGFKHTTLDLAGYRRGSLNEGLIELSLVK